MKEETVYLEACNKVYDEYLAKIEQEDKTDKEIEAFIDDISKIKITLRRRE